MPGEDRKTSVQDIAAMLLTPVAGEAETSVEEELADNSPAEGTTDDDLITDDTAADDADEQVAEETEDDAEDDTEEEEEQQVVDIQDEDLIDVMIDGKLETLTIGALKKAASLSGATEKRLHEATEIRKTALAERTTALENLTAQESIIAATFNDLEETLFKAVIPPPNPKMKDTNPAGYLRHKEAFDEDQARIASARKAAADKVQEFSNQRTQRLKEYGETAAKEIVQLIPELQNPQKAPQVLGRLVETAKAYGYTDQEISTALDPRMFHLVRDAMAYRDLTSRAKETKVTDVSAQRNKPIRKLRSGNTKAATVVAAQSKKQQDARAAASKTGSVKDVAATLLIPKGK